MIAASAAATAMRTAVTARWRRLAGACPPARVTHSDSRRAVSVEAVRVPPTRAMTQVRSHGASAMTMPITAPIAAASTARPMSSASCAKPAAPVDANTKMTAPGPTMRSADTK